MKYLRGLFKKKKKEMKKIINKLKYKLRSRLRNHFHLRKLSKLRNEIINHYSINPPEDKEIADTVKYLLHHRLSTFYSYFQEKYNAEKISVYKDSVNGLPHEFCINESDVMADVGSAEGYFTLLNIEKLKKVYLFEQDSEWLEALETTFAPWKDKVVIIPKFVSYKNSGNEISLDSYFMNEKNIPGFFKIDVEGAEASVLKGMEKLMLNSQVRIALCTYHHQEDFQKFSNFFESEGFLH